MSQTWVFGYGSLVWRPDFPAAESRPAYVEDFLRRFWQGSSDHRGVPGAPGRVVTLVRRAGARTWGRAYRVTGAHREEVLARLDHRERGGYSRHRVRLVFQDGGSVSGLVYRATEDNESYLGPAPLPTIAEQIVRSHGPSGANVDYLEELWRALRSMEVSDPHVEELLRLVRRARARAQGPPESAT